MDFSEFVEQLRDLDEYLSACCTRHGGQPALADSETSLTYAELDEYVSRAAEQIAQVSEGGPIVVLMDNRVDSMVRLFACWRLGRCAVPLDMSVPEAVILKALERTGSGLVSGFRLTTAEASSTPDELLDGAALTIFTSGSTGTPKGVVLSHEGILAKLRMVQEALDYRAGDRTLAVLRSSFLFCLWDVLLTLGTGGRVRLVERFDPTQLCELLTNEAVDRMAVVPTMLRRLMPILERADVRSALAGVGSPARVIVGGELLAEQTGRRYRSLLPHSAIAVIYGLTETSAPDFILPGDEYDDHAETVGRALSGVRWRLADRDGSLPAPGDRGVLEVKSAGVLRGYVGQPDLTRSTVRDGYFRTGDTVEVRADGRIVVHGRGATLVSKGANKIAPTEVEAVLEQHPDVVSAFVCGVPDAILGERLFAAVAVRSADLVGEALLPWIAERVERYKVPDFIEARTTLPEGVTGKLDRAALGAWARSLVDAAQGSGAAS